MKILSLDLGDKWIGSAISDALGITCRTYKTIEITELHAFLNKTLVEEGIQTVFFDLPTTMSVTQSYQTTQQIRKKETPSQ